MNQLKMNKDSMTDTSSPSEKKSTLGLIKKMSRPRNVLVLVLVLLAAGFAYYFYQYQKLSKNAGAEQKQNIAEVIKKISALAVVPNDPQAVLATVSDVTKLKGQHFFDNAQNGDYIVLFPSAMEAILYRPSINKIVNIGPLSSGANGTPQVSATPSKSAAPSPKATPSASTIKK